MLRALALFSLAAAFLSKPAMADQCAWVEKDTADKAKARIEKAGKVVHFCEPCGDKSPSPVDAVKKVQVLKQGESHWQVHLNGKGIDLAYVYVPTQKDTWRNIGRALQCGADGVSPELGKGGLQSPNGPNPGK